MVDLKQIEYLSLTRMKGVPGKTFSASLPALDTVIVGIVVGKRKQDADMYSMGGISERRPANQNATQTLPREKDRHIRANSGSPQTERHLSSVVCPGR